MPIIDDFWNNDSVQCPNCGKYNHSLRPSPEEGAIVSLQQAWEYIFYCRKCAGLFTLAEIAIPEFLEDRFFLWFTAVFPGEPLPWGKTGYIKQEESDLASLSPKDFEAVMKKKKDEALKRAWGFI